MAGMELERDEFMADRPRRKRMADLSRVQEALSELGLGAEEVGVDFLVETVQSMQPNRFFERNGEKTPTQQAIAEQGLAGWLVVKLAERKLE